MDTPGVQNVSSVIGYSLLSGVQTTYSAFFFISFKPWDERKTPDESYDAIKLHLMRGLVAGQCRHRIRLPAARHPGRRHLRWIHLHSGRPIRQRHRFSGQEYAGVYAGRPQAPELSGVMTTALFGVPQVGVNVDNAKVLTQQIPLSNVYQTLQTFMGGSLVNYFNRFGLQWQVYVQADGDFRTNAKNLGKFYVKNTAGEMVPLSTLTSTDPRSGTEFVMRYNLFSACRSTPMRRPGYSSGQAMAAVEEVFKQTMPGQMGYDWSGMSYQEQKAAQGVSPGDHLRPVVLGRVPHHGGAV